MIQSFRGAWQDMLRLFYPQLCPGCDGDLPQPGDVICISCSLHLPETGFAPLPGNPVEKIFWGRVQLVAAHSQWYFAKGHIIQHLMHALKYKGNSGIGEWMGRCLGEQLGSGGRFGGVDYIVPMPLYAKREFQRGYNQAAMIGKGISEITGIPQLTGMLIRKHATDTQTRKSRADRWLNVSGNFHVVSAPVFASKHILLVDDVLTTGATLEAACNVLQQITGCRISIATAAIASR